MPQFQFEAKDAQGKTVRDRIDAADKKAAINAIRARGLTPSKLKEDGGGAGAPAGGGGGGGGGTASRSRGGGGGGSSTGSIKAEPSAKTGSVPLAALAQFTTQLAILQDAGLPIVRSLKILEAQQTHSRFKSIVGQVSTDVEGGQPLSDAMAKHPKCFDRLYTNMIKAGEAGGVLDTILNRLAEFMEKNQALKRKIVGAAIYPLVVLSIAVLIMAGLLIFVVPTFESMFEDLNIALPLPTQILLTVADVAVNFWWLLPVVPILGYIGFKAWTATENGRYMWDVIKLKIPIVGTIVKKGTIARFTRTLGTLIASGVAILEALAIVKNAVGNEVLTRAVNEVYESIREGNAIAEPLADSDIFDDLVVNMIAVGEETGELDKMLMKVADQYDAEVDVAVDSMTSVLEPIMIVFMGAGVGFIVISLFLPMISIIQNLG